jgi:hypothetical protein
MPAFGRTDIADTDHVEITTHYNVTDLDIGYQAFFFLAPQRVRYLKAMTNHQVAGELTTQHMSLFGEKRRYVQNRIIDFCSTKHALFIITAMDAKLLDSK